LISIAALLLAGACTQTPSEPASRVTVVRFSTGAPGGGFYPFGAALADAFAKTLRDISIEVKPSTGAVANVQAIQRGEADIGLAFADVAYLAYVGQLDGERARFDQLRAIAVLQLTPVQLVARGGSGIASVSDLRGRRVSVGPPGSGTALTARLIFEAFGIAAGAVHTESLSFNDSSVRLTNGTLDAMFDTAIYPAESAARALRAGARLVPITGPAVEQLRREYPFLKPTLLPRETYPGAAAITTVGVDSLLVCHRALDETVVHDLTAQLFQALPSMSSFRRLRLTELDEAPAAPIPLHDGAARYYREQELLR
jgi:TRAP transporter TAXI family solute receptor